MISNKKWHRHQSRCVETRVQRTQLKRERRLERIIPPLGETLKPFDTTGKTEELNKILGESVWPTEDW